MNPRALLFAPVSLFLVPLLTAQTEKAPEAPVPVVQASSPRLGSDVGPRVENQRVYGPGRDTLISRQAADGVLEGFRKAYVTDHAPRVVVYVNRALVDTSSGLKLTGHTERYEKTANEEKGVETTATSKTSGTNTYQAREGTAPTLADRQTVREVERLVGRVFRHAGAQLADQGTAAALIEENPGHRLVGDQAAKDRAALAAIADIAIEVLISSRNLTVAEVSGDTTVAVPDIQFTAIRLKDSAIVGQASASDILGKDRAAGRVVKQFDIRDITEASAIALIEDMLTGVK